MSQFVVPGDILAEESKSDISGPGTRTTNGNIISEFVGSAKKTNGIWSIERKNNESFSFNQGDVIIGSIIRLQESIAIVEILAKEGSNHSSLLPEYSEAEISVGQIVDRYMHEPRDAFRIRDIIRAEIINHKPIMRLSTKKGGGYGVLHAQCPKCGQMLQVNLDKSENNVKCIGCNYIGYRVLSDGFGNGGVKTDSENSLSKLNGSGRWSEAMETSRKADRISRGVMIGRDSPRDLFDPSCRLFIGGLSKKTETSDLRELFATCGHVVDAFAMKDKESGEMKGFGFVTMSEPNMAQRAIKKLNKFELHGRRIAVRPAGEDRKKNKHKKKKWDQNIKSKKYTHKEKNISPKNSDTTNKPPNLSKRPKRELNAMLEEGIISKDEYNQAQR